MTRRSSNTVLLPQAGASAHAEEEQHIAAIWHIHCSCLHDSVAYTDPVVNDIWQLFEPALQSTEVLPIHNGPGLAAVPTTSSSTTAVPYTHYFELDLGDAEAAGSSALGGVSFTSGGLRGPHCRVTAAMRAALEEQPHVVLPLLEFFVAVISSRQPSSARAPVQGAPPHGSASGGGDGEGGGTPASAAIGRVFCSVLGDTRHPAPFELLGAAQLGRLVTVHGTVVRMSPTRITCLVMSYRCGLCGAVKRLPAEDGVLVYPGPCTGRCRGYKWAPLPAQSICEEVQLLKLQEHTNFMDASLGDEGGGGGGGGGVNKMMEVELRVPLLERVTVGEAVHICGILGTRRGERKAGGTMQVCLRARSLCGLRRGADADETAPWSPEESGRFYEMARHPRWLDRLTASVAPSIYGMHNVKQALLLAVVGGATHILGTRSSIHVLLLGDPGLGKSQLLRAACAVAPRSAFVCAHTSSACGLTMTLSRDPLTGEATFEAGAVVHGDGGVTCIDEIDKGVHEHRALLEVMEQETVSIAKAGMVFSMPVHTSVLAAGNPVGGRFDLRKPISANANLSPALLSRFDILVCLRDPHAANTSSLTTHVLQLHRHKGAGGPRGAGEAGGGSLPAELVHRFVAFCRTQCEPVLREEAAEVLKAHYLEQRARPPEERCLELPITPRYLQALIRVAEARARVELRHEVNREDALFAVQLLQDCLGTLSAPGDTAAGALGLPARSGGSPKKNQRVQVLDVLRSEVVRCGGHNRLSRSTVLAACEDVGCRNPEAMLYQLNEYGFLLQSGDKFVLRGV